MGLGTIVNALSIGFIADLGLYLIPEQHRLVVRIPFLLGSVILFGTGAGLSIGSGLGGHVGVGTVLLAFAIGPATHAGLRRFHLPVHDDAPEVLGE